ncbi:hypothetical protein [Mucilaginibacter sp.]|jgi:hypothetical protein|uniref:hypothetical protein n=1 Tax=Mucilaginibacter sp. TaxID=1882438 RepID=UPI002C8CFFFA|nr:hypothetical protein [Mucilaginibacter sp.]HTI58385.1 hypothetical protein [Mucilaginibacter sp.]
MVTGTTSYNLNRLKNLADWKLLLFLVLFLDVKLIVKVAAIVLIYLLQFDFKFGFSLKNSRLPLFYPAVIGIAILDWLIGGNHSLNYSLVLVTGIGFWLLCILAMHQVKLSVDNHDTETIHRTLILFFILNALLSFINIAAIVYETGYLNPYTYQGQHQKYFIGTGDYIRGLTFDTSTTNAVLSAFGVIYFLSKKNTAMLLLCMAVLLLTGSNFINILLSAVLLAILIIKSSRDQKSLVSICFMFLVLFAVKISPQSYVYVHETIKNNFFPQPIVKKSPVKPLPYITLRPDSTLTPEERREKTARGYLDSVFLAVYPNPMPQPPRYPIRTSGGRIIVPGVNILLSPYQHAAETTAYQRQLLGYIDRHKAVLPLSGDGGEAPRKMGKMIASNQTINFLKAHPIKLIAGNGVGNFSSKLAFRASGIGLAGGYPHQYTYVNTDFLTNHLDLYLSFFSKKSDYQSLTNYPGSVYDQLLAEYGLLGVLCFSVCYLWYFAQHYKKLTYGIPMFIMLLAVLTTDYWFEQLSVILLFELLMLLNIKESYTKLNPSHAN